MVSFESDVTFTELDGTEHDRGETLSKALPNTASTMRWGMQGCLCCHKEGSSRWRWVLPPCCDGAWEKCQEELIKYGKCLALAALAFFTVFVVFKLTVPAKKEAVDEMWLHQKYMMVMTWLLGTCRGLLHRFGLIGLWGAIFVCDYVPPGFPMEPVILVGVLAKVPDFMLLGTCFAGSYSAAILGYWTGACLARMRCSAKHLTSLTAKYPEVLSVLQKRGAYGVGAAALLPVPFPVATWGAGALAVRFSPDFLVAASLRLPKIGFYLIVSTGLQMASTVGQSGAQPALGNSTNSTPTFLL